MPTSTLSRRHRRRLPRAGALLAAALFLGQAATADLEPTATITALDVKGMAPFAVHVHALDTSLGVGTPLTARYQWDFGDPLGAHNTLDGWNASHFFEQSGVYTITLKVTNEAGLDDIAVAVVMVMPDVRQSLYVSGEGDDANHGLTPLAPLRTFGRAIELLDNGTAVRFRRGDVFDIASTGAVNDSNVLFTTYGVGADPVLRWTGALGTAGMIEVAGAGPKDVVVEDLHFDSIYQADAAHDVVDAVYPGGANTTIARCTFTNLSYAVNGNRSPCGVLCIDNVAGSLGTYFLWAQGSDYTLVNNVVEGSIFEHNLRLGGVDRVLIAGNKLTNEPKRTIWVMRGSFCYVTQNVLTDGRITVGPNPDGEPDDRFTYAVIERNLIEKTVDSTAAVEVLAGAEHSILRNNIILADGVHAIAVTGVDEALDRTSLDTSILNNTAINNETNGRFLWMSADAEQVRLANNLYVAPNLVTGESQTANVYVLDDNVESFTIIRRNVWAIPDEFVWVDDGFHYVWPYWSEAEGYHSPIEWHVLDPVDVDTYERVVLDESFAPPTESIASTHAQPITGMFDDFHGNPRMLLAQSWTAGAVELNLGDVVDSPGVDADLNGDGVVDTLDLLILLGAWGQTDSPADLNEDDIVDTEDLLILLGSWD